MSQIFLSHSSKDNFEAVAVRNWLRSEGWDNIFLDLDPERGIAAGERWERALHKASSRCEAVVFLVSANWLASGWCLKEYMLARGLNKKLFAVLIDPGRTIADLPAELTGTWQVVDLVSGLNLHLMRSELPGSHEEKHIAFSRDGLLRLKRGLEKAGLDPKFFAWPPESEPDRMPFRGLKPFEGRDAGIFFGRDAPIVEATDCLRGLKAAAAPRLLVILGASGAGKSSFLRAGILPRLARDDAHFLPLPVIRPERAALFGENGLLPALEAVFPTRTRADLRASIQAGAKVLRALLAEIVTEQFGRTLREETSDRPPAVVIAIDQAEELFRADGGTEPAALLTLLLDLAVEDGPEVIVVFAIRSDTYDALEHAKPLEGLPQTTLPLLPMPLGAYKEVIEGPARRAAEAGFPLAIEPRLTERLLGDLATGGSDTLPLLACTLEQLFLEFRRAGSLRLSDYEAFGGFKGAIDAAVDRAFARADEDHRIPRERQAREALLRRGLIPWLAGIDPDSRAPRRNMARRSDIPLEAEPLVNLLVEERLLSTDTELVKDLLTGSETRVATIEPTHEALLRQWGLLAGWLEEDFAFLTTLESVKRGARDWNANGRSPAWLAHQGQRLAEAQALDDRQDIAARLDPIDRAYMAECRFRDEELRLEAEHRRAEREQEQTRRLEDAERLTHANRRTTRRTLAGLAVAIALAVLAALFGVYANLQKSIAEQRTADAIEQTAIASRQTTIANEQSSLADKQKRVAEQKTEEALTQRKSAKYNQSAALAALSSAALSTSPVRAAKLALASWPRNSTDDSPQLTPALNALYAAYSRLRERKTFFGGGRPIEGCSFSSDGRRLLTVSDDNVSELWDLSSSKKILTTRGHEGKINYAAFSPDGKFVISAFNDGVARIWDIETGTEAAVLKGHDDAILHAVFSSDGRRVLTASADTTARLWDTTTGQQLAQFNGHGGWVASARFSPNTSLIVTASYDGTARIWDIQSKKTILTLRGHSDAVLDASFSPDGGQVVTGSKDHTAIIWNSRTGQQMRVLRGHDEAILSAEFSPDGNSIVTASEDRSARVWDAKDGTEEFPLRGHDKSVSQATFSADGLFVATMSEDGTAKIWAVAHAAQKGILTYKGNYITEGAWSPDGGLIAVISGNGVAAVLDIQTGKVVSTLKGEKLSCPYSGVCEYVSVAFSQASRPVIVTASEDKTARVWDARSGKQITLLRGHSKRLVSADLSPDGKRIVTASDDNTVRVWNTRTSEQMFVIHGDWGNLKRANFTSDNLYVVVESVGANEVSAFDADSGREVTSINSLFGGFKSDTDTHFDTYSFQSRRFITGRYVVGDGGPRNSIDLWSMDTGRPIANLPHAGLINFTAFSADGKRIVTTSEDRTARVWDAATGKQLLSLQADDWLGQAAFSQDGKSLFAVKRGGSVVIWDISTLPEGSLFQVACSLLPDYDLGEIVLEYGLADLDPICVGEAPTFSKQ